MSKHTGNAPRPERTADDRVKRGCLPDKEPHRTGGTGRTFRDPRMLELFGQAKVRIQKPLS